MNFWTNFKGLLCCRWLKGPKHSKNEIYFFRSCSKEMQPIFVSYKARFSSKKNETKKQWSSRWPRPLLDQCFIKDCSAAAVVCKLLLFSASYDIKIGFIQFLWAEAKKYKILFLLCARHLTENLIIYKCTVTRF